MALVDRQGSNLNRKKLTVISTSKHTSGELKELVVDMDRADTATIAGTPLNAASLNAEIANVVANNPYIRKATADTQEVYDSSSAVATTQFVWNVLIALGHAKIVKQSDNNYSGSGGD